jgi:L-lactate dehydrogenase complex protein LldG
LPESIRVRPEADRLVRFVESARAASAEIERLPTHRLADRLSDLLTAEGTPVLVSDGDDPLIRQSSAALRAGGLELIEPASLSLRESPKVGLTGVEAALADTGSLILLSGEGRSLLTSLLPWLHVAIVRASRVVNSFSEWLEEGGGRRLASVSQAVIVTGPSRTADIEMTLTVGVHGPGRLVILLIDDA